MNCEKWTSIGRNLVAAFWIIILAMIVLGRTVFRDETDRLFDQALSQHPILMPGIMILVFAGMALDYLRKAWNGRIAYFLLVLLPVIAIGFSVYLFVQGIKNVL